MFSYSLLEISQVVSGKVFGTSAVVVNQFFTDSRKIVPGTSGLFFAIKGQNQNGHTFIKQVYTFGVRNFLISDVSYVEKLQLEGANFIIVDDALRAFQKLAAYYRSSFDIPVIGVTGSNGKTIVKEWLYFLLKKQFSTIRSPKSYNSQIGVPLSVLLMNKYHEMAIFEAGISEIHEMQNLQPIINPKLVVFTNVGNAHQENFESLEQKVFEKLQLAINAELLVYCSDYEVITKVLERKEFSHLNTLTWAFNRDANVKITEIKTLKHGTEIIAKTKSKKIEFQIPFTDRASIENAIHCFMIMFSAGLIRKSVLKQFATLPQVAMRLELKEGINNCTIINDTYNSDLESIKIAVDFLKQQNQQTKKTLIISDIQQSDLPEKNIYQEIRDIVLLNKIDKLILIGDKFIKYRSLFPEHALVFAGTEAFLGKVDSNTFENEVILIKGARRYEFERIAKLLEYKTHQTVLEINLNAIVTNLNYFRSLLNASTKLMVMVKAFSYGSGSFEIANLLQHNRVDYLAVAFVDEGVDLRKSGITLPIVVMNPEITSFPVMVENNLEPEVYSLSSLRFLIRALSQIKGTNEYPIHLKIDTGMKRMGFEAHEVDQLIAILSDENLVKVSSIFSHLSGSDDEKFDDFTKQQINIFTELSNKIKKALGGDIMCHILNSAGIERFPKAQFDMVRLGIGLYGISAVKSNKTTQISTLKTSISQIKHVGVHETVGYSRNGVVSRDSKIAILPIGYADGLDRALSNGVGSVLIHGKKAPFIGNICMDACMVDITDIDAMEGDDVVVFGNGLPITEMADKLQTIPYEILTGISRRVKRVYFQE